VGERNIGQTSGLSSYKLSTSDVNKLQRLSYHKIRDESDFSPKNENELVDLGLMEMTLLQSNDDDDDESLGLSKINVCGHSEKMEVIFLMLWLEVVPSDGISILPLICAWPPRGCTI
jgi:hypothetical protein